MNLTNNTLPVNEDTSTSVTNDNDESAQSNIADEFVERHIPSANNRNKPNVINTENGVGAGGNLHEDIRDRRDGNAENDSALVEPTQNGSNVNSSNRGKFLLERVFDLIRADHEQSSSNEDEPAPESFTSPVTETQDDVSDSDEKQYKCDKCDLQFARHSSLMWHMQSHATVQNVRGRKTDLSDPFLIEQYTNRDATVLEESGPIVCDFCDKVFPSLRGKKVHVSHVHKFEAPVDPAPDDPDDEFNMFTCLICDREFVSAKAMKVHVSHMHNRNNTHCPNGKGVFSCEICHKEFETTRARNVHVSHMHKTDAKLDSSAQVDSLANVNSSMDGVSPFPCDLCNKEFDTLKALKIHVSHKHKTQSQNTSLSADASILNEYEMFPCEFCKKEFETLTAKKIHVSHMHKTNAPPRSNVSSLRESSLSGILNEQEVFSCKLCGKEFHSTKAMKLHMFHMHKTTEFPLRTKNASDTNALIRVANNRFACGSCDRQFASVIALRVHITHMHTRIDSEPPNDSGTFTCEFCDKDFVTTRARSIHMAHTHKLVKRPSSGLADASMDSADEAEFVCKLCDKVFESSKARKIHNAHMHKEVTEKDKVATPSEDGPFTCEICDKDFESLKAKKIHVTRMHSADVDSLKPKFSFRRDRSEDFVPNLEQVFPCHLCERTFSCKKGLSRHVGHHNLVDKLPKENGIDSTKDDAQLVPSSPLDDNTDDIDPTLNDVNHEEITSSLNDTAIDDITVSESVPCPNCNKEFETSKAMKIHMKRMHYNASESNGKNIDQSQSEEESCNVNAKTVSLLRTHSGQGRPIPEDRNEIRVLECSFCHVHFETVSSMHAHIAKDHDDEPSYSCTFCRKIFSSVIAFSSHIKGICGTAQCFDGIYLFACDECPKTFSHPKSLQRHWRCDHAQEPAELETDVSDTSASDACELPANKSSKSPSSQNKDGNFKCPVCSRSFSNVRGMAGHMSVHTQAQKKRIMEKKEVIRVEESFECSFCKKLFSSVKARAAHIKVHYRARRTWSESSEKVKVHIEESELGTRVKSPQKEGDTHHHLSNDVGANTKTNLKAIGSIHQCSLCPKTFSKTKALANHSRIHEFACKSCPKAFISVKALNAHLKTHRRTTGSLVMPSERKIEFSNRPNVSLFDAASHSNSKFSGVAHRPNLNVNVSVKPISETATNSDHRAASFPVTSRPPVTTSVKQFKCQHCPRSFPNLKGISTHSRVHGNKKENCSFEASFVESAPSKANIIGFPVPAANVLDVVIPKEKFDCKYCPKTFTNAKAVAVHSRIHKEADDSSMDDEPNPEDEPAIINKGKEFKCLFCPRVFEHERALIGHLKAHSQKEYNCPHCDKVYTSMKALGGHIKFHKYASVSDTRRNHSAVGNDQMHDIEVDQGGEEGDMFPCQFCGRKFTTHRCYTRHVWIHTHGSDVPPEEIEEMEQEHDKPFSCRICGIKFASGRQLGGHMRHHSYAGHTFPEAYDSIHVDTDNLDGELNDEEQFICDTCDEIFESRKDLSEHVRNHADPLLMVDTSPGADYEIAPTTPQTHRSGYLMCHICDRLFSGEKSLSTHMFKKHKKRKGLHGYSPQKVPGSFLSGQNNEVASTFTRKRAASPTNTIDLENELLEDPIDMMSSPRKRICKSYEPMDIRRGVSSTSSRLAFGLRTNGEIYAQNQPNLAAQFCEKSYECMYCEKHFKEKSKLVQHVRTHPESTEHTDQELQDYLNLHTREHFVVQNQHGNEERFIFEQYTSGDGYRCSECDETFREKLQMLIHMSYHMDSKQSNGEHNSLVIKADSSLLAPFKCNFCSQRFINKKYRNLHLCKRHRSDILQCEICQKLFICKETLKQHYEQHTEQNQSTLSTRYQCEYCGMCFRSKIILKRHTETECEMASTEKAGETDNDDCEIVDNRVVKQEPTSEESIEEQDLEDDETVNAKSANGSFDQQAFRPIGEEKFKTDGGVSSIGSFICDCCNKRFGSEIDMQTHENQPQRLLFCCGLCNLYFIDTRNAEIHSKMHIIEQESDIDIDG